MPPNLKKKPMQLPCEWYDCETKCDTMEAFTIHIHKHIAEFLPPGIDIDNYVQFQIISQDEYHCQWADCGFITLEGPVMLTRHLFFHAYHCKIKWWATQERVRCKMGPCMLDHATRNLIPELPQKFHCAWADDICGFTTDNAEHFYRHADMHASVSEQELVGNQMLVRCKWSDCTGCYKDKYKLLDHLRSHTQEKRFACDQCGALFSNRTKYIDHIHRQTALDLQSYQCSHCSKIFASERLLRDHMRHHVNHYKCPFCDMTCPAPSGLKSHIKYRHSEERMHECQYCNFKAKKAADLRRHITTHDAGKQYWCEHEGCNFTARSLLTLKRHYSREHVENKAGLYKYCCHVCNTRFIRGFSLTWHLKTKHKFKWPSGHCRFRYKEHDDGLLRLQTVRYESIELTQQLLAEKEEAHQSESTDGDNGNSSRSQIDVPSTSTSVAETIDN
ncbi:histone H4 transcription factor-like [Amphiura filiformis]|uniref:histone H4 transcription factor-like n=1 Tax=Amphiura filiformis TaxID=82378 RepID=UPI003B21E423